MFAWFKRFVRFVHQPDDFEGPAKLEVFGHDKHVGWVRCRGALITILTVDGRALQLDLRSRFRLEPLTFIELAEACLRERACILRSEHTTEEALKSLRAERQEQANRAHSLRRALELVAESEGLDGGTTRLVRETLEKDENDHDLIPF